MKAELQVEIKFDQILALVKKLPTSEKIKLIKELECEEIDGKLSELLTTFRTKKLSQKTIDQEVEIVRQKIYENQKH